MPFLKFTILIHLFFVSNQILSQEYEDWPSYENYYIEKNQKFSGVTCGNDKSKKWIKISPKTIRDYYCLSGNLNTEGTVISETSFSTDASNKSIERTTYIRDGQWQVYFDSSIQILRSKGDYNKGKRNGIWTIYSITGNPKFEFLFVNDIVKQKIEIDENGERHKTISRSNANIFVERNKSLLMLVALLPITLLRIGYNILTYNKIRQTNYIPMFQNWQPGGIMVNFMCTFIFWWLFKKQDNYIARKYKRVANIISVTSVIIFSSIYILLILFDDSK